MAKNKNKKKKNAKNQNKTKDKTNQQNVLSRTHTNPKTGKKYTAT